MLNDGQLASHGKDVEKGGSGDVTLKTILALAAVLVVGDVLVEMAGDLRAADPPSIQPLPQVVASQQLPQQNGDQGDTQVPFVERPQPILRPVLLSSDPAPESSTRQCPSLPSRADCMIRLDGNDPRCEPDPQEVEAQGAYFMKNWLPEFRNGRATDVLGPAVVFSRRLQRMKLTSPGGICEGQEVLSSMQAIGHELTGECTVFDVGANIGTYADWLLDNLPQHCQIYSYEPVPPTWKTLKKRHEKHPRVHPYNKAVSDTVGMTIISFGKPGDRGAKLGGNSAFNARVPMVTVDSEIAQVGGTARIPFVKVDVEGLEYSVLKGLEDSLRDRRVRAILWERNAEQHQCGCGITEPSKRCGCTPKNSMRDEVELVASYGYHVFLPGTKYFLRIDGKYWHDDYEIDILRHTGRRSPVINLLGVVPGDPILAHIMERQTMLRPPGVFAF